MLVHMLTTSMVTEVIKGLLSGAIIMDVQVEGSFFHLDEFTTHEQKLNGSTISGRTP